MRKKRLLFMLVIVTLLFIGASFYLWDFHLFGPIFKVNGPKLAAEWKLQTRYGIAEGFFLGAALVASLSFLPDRRPGGKGHWLYGLLAVPFLAFYELCIFINSTAFSAGGLGGTLMLGYLGTWLDLRGMFHAFNFLGYMKFSAEAILALWIGCNLWAKFRGIWSAFSVASYSIFSLGIMLLLFDWWEMPLHVTNLMKWSYGGFWLVPNWAVFVTSAVSSVYCFVRSIYYAPKGPVFAQDWAQFCHRRLL